MICKADCRLKDFWKVWVVLGISPSPRNPKPCRVATVVGASGRGESESSSAQEGLLFRLYIRFSSVRRQAKKNLI